MSNPAGARQPPGARDAVERQSDDRVWCPWESGKGRQRDTEFSVFSDAVFVELFYARRAELDDSTRLRVEREAKARGIRNVQKRNVRPSGQYPRTRYGVLAER